MPKKGSGRSRESVQKSRQAQWQRRVAAQGGAPVVSARPVGVGEEAETVAPVEMGTGDGAAVGAARTSTPARASTSRSRISSPATTPSAGSAAQRRTAPPARGSARLRMAANQMSIEDEMSYIRSDIRRLVILTALCLLVLIALTVVVR